MKILFYSFMLCSGLLNRTKHATVKLKINTVGDGITINHFCTTSFKKRVENISHKWMKMSYIFSKELML